jgi:acetyl esterase/lipase
MNLWPHGAPGEQTSDAGHVTDDSDASVLRLTDVTTPRLFLGRPDDQPGRPTVLVFPGGGYQILAADLEGSEVAAWLNRLGFVAAVLHYRVPGKRDAAYQDAQRAVSLLRARSEEAGIDPRRVGVLGFSAGGHLAARLASGAGERTYRPVDHADGQSCLPDFALLIYPAYLTGDAETGRPAPEVEPHKDMPPVFLTQALDDPYLTAPAYAAALEAVGVPTRSALYDTGGHGYGLRLPPSEPAHAWPDEAAAWLRRFRGPRK